MKPTTVHAQKVESLLNEFESAQKRIAERAFEIFRTRGAQLGAALDDWLAAERETVWKPPIEITERDGRLIIEAAVAGVQPNQLHIQMTADTVLLKAEANHDHDATEGTVHVCEFQPGRLFRAVRLPVNINPDGAKAEYRNGLLRLSAPIAAAAAAKPVDVRVS